MSNSGRKCSGRHLYFAWTAGLVCATPRSPLDFRLLRDEALKEPSMRRVSLERGAVLLAWTPEEHFDQEDEQLSSIRIAPADRRRIEAKGRAGERSSDK